MLVQFPRLLATFLLVCCGVTTAHGAPEASKPIAVPWVISTFVGGPSYDSIRDVVVAANGDVYVVGDENAAFWPGEKLLPVSQTWSTQVFIARFSAQGRLLAHAVVGGSDSDNAAAIALDAQGRIIIVGYTNSRDWAIVDVATGARHLRAKIQGERNFYNTNTFIASFGADLSPRWVRRLGGSDQDFPNDVALDSKGNVYLTGTTGSPDFPLRGAPRYGRNGKASSASGIATDAFLAKISPAGDLIFSTLIGGKSYDTGDALALTRNGDIVLCGDTSSNDFPRARALDVISAANGTPTARSKSWVYRLSGDARQLRFATILEGGAGAVELGADDTIYLGGARASLTKDVHGQFPVDACVTVLRADGAKILSSIAWGGDREDSVTGLALASDNSVWVTGFTESGDFPLKDAFARIAGGGTEGFVAHIKDGQLLRCELLGGDDRDTPAAIALAPGGDLWIAGATDSANFPIRRAWQPERAGRPTSFDSVFSAGFLMRFSTLAPAPDVTPPTISVEAPRRGAELVYLRDFRGFARDGADGSGVARVEVDLQAVLSETPKIGLYQNLRAGQRVYWAGYAWQDKPLAEAAPSWDAPWWRRARVSSETWDYARAPNQFFPTGRGTKRPDLLSGRYTLRVTATDRAGNRATSETSFSVKADDESPIATFTSPARLAQFRAWNVIGGRAYDTGGSGVERVEVNLRRMPPNAHWGDKDLDYDNVADWTGTGWARTFYLGPGEPYWLPAIYANGRWHFDNVPRGADLKPGNYRVRVRTYDRAGNSNERRGVAQSYRFRDTALEVRVLQ